MKRSINACPCQIVLCGRGGQGILFLTRVLTEVALLRGHSVISSETHGMAMRGGSVVSFIKIGDFFSPLIRSKQADILFVLSETELIQNQHFARPTGSQIYINAKEPRKRSIDADSLAVRLGSPVTANLVLLGFACAHPDFPYSHDEIAQCIRKISTASMVDQNLKSFYEGYYSFS
ncbi:MAG: 2-oxoacid:acceptor oxidoreductase family protein [Desulfobacterota bacterium]|nr:2-oxoacid:acceptor oxidoreductase family protein [Thermodesulfobacteriota bacterium]